MESKRRTLLVLTMAAAILVLMPCSVAQDNDDDNTQTREGQRMQRPGEGPGPRSGERFGRGGPGRPEGRWRRPELTDEQIDGILKELKERDPNNAKELTDLRTNDPEKFRIEFRRHAWPEISRAIMVSWENRRRTEFLEWLEKYVPKEAEALAKLKESEPNLYAQNYQITLRKYNRIYEHARRNSELAPVLVADLQLAEREDELVKKINAAKTEQEKAELTAQLEEVVADKYDLIVRRKQIEYEGLLRRLEALQKQVRASLEDIKVWRDDTFKAKNVKERIEDLTEERKTGFRWN